MCTSDLLREGSGRDPQEFRIRIVERKKPSELSFSFSQILHRSTTVLIILQRVFQPEILEPLKESGNGKSAGVLSGKQLVSWPQGYRVVKSMTSGLRVLK